MKLRAVHSAGRLLSRLRRADSALREAALDASAEALRSELAARNRNVVVGSRGSRRSVGSSDPSDIARELGTLEQTPSPWLAPVLPLALEPMRAAANSAVARAVSTLRSGKK
ncbi:MAG: hypothetical protein Q8K85_16850 [Hyphomicrobium sp.]|nr:hypothetical protein [Hyphomicrobium sp.]